MSQSIRLAQLHTCLLCMQSAYAISTFKQGLVLHPGWQASSCCLTSASYCEPRLVFVEVSLMAAGMKTLQRGSSTRSGGGRLECRNARGARWKPLKQLTSHLTPLGLQKASPDSWPLIWCVLTLLSQHAAVFDVCSSEETSVVMSLVPCFHGQTVLLFKEVCLLLASKVDTKTR